MHDMLSNKHAVSIELGTKMVTEFQGGNPVTKDLKVLGMFEFLMPN